MFKKVALVFLILSVYVLGISAEFEEMNMNRGLRVLSSNQICSVICKDHNYATCGRIFKSCCNGSCHSGIFTNSCKG